MTTQNGNYKWYILLLSVLTEMFVIAIPLMAMSVLSKEIAADLKLNLVQVGVVWGVGSLLGIFTSLLGGLIGDKFGPRLVLAVGCLLGGLLGVARGMADNFLSLTIAVIFLGAVTSVVLMNSIKTAALWFPSNQLGLANGIIGMGMALGFMIGSLLSATVLSPMLGGWRNVMIVYGVIGTLLSIPWYFSKNAPHVTQSTATSITFGKAIAHVASQKRIWLLSLAFLGIGGAIQGMLGYLPLHLRDLGWQPLQADGSLSVFFVCSMIFVLPFTLLSDRSGSRKRFVLAAGLVIAIGIGILSFATGGWVWVAVILAGAARDSFMAIFLTMIIETEDIGALYGGTATGFAMAIGQISNVVAPPIGNSLTTVWTGAPFAFWSVLCVLGFVCLLWVKEGNQNTKNLQAEAVM